MLRCYQPRKWRLGNKDTKKKSYLIIPILSAIIQTKQLNTLPAFRIVYQHSLFDTIVLPKDVWVLVIEMKKVTER